MNEKYGGLISFIQDQLPTGVFVYCPRPQKFIKIKLIDWNETIIYYQFTLEAALGLPQLMEESVKEIKKFEEMWYSPLSKIMRE